MTDTLEPAAKDAGKRDTKPAPWLKPVLEIGPLILFFFANSRPKLFEPLVSHILPAHLQTGANAGLFTATAVLMPAVVAALIASYVLTRRVPIMPLVTAVNQALDRLEEGFRLQRQFTADAAHQLRTPLAILRTRIETLDDRAAQQALHADIESMSRLVAQLLEIAELDTLVRDPGETADLRAVCAEVVGSIAPFAIAQHKDIALKGTDAPVLIQGNSEMIQRAIFNLAENAIKFTAKDTSVDVEVREDGSVRVRDCGPGIAEAERELIFQRFWRADRRRSDGAGLGLSIVRAVADDHGATIAVANLPGGGAEFTLRFRLAEKVA